jgi:hypothetical protein
VKVVRIQEAAGSFAENKDVAAVIRDALIVPTVRAGQSITLDFEGVRLTTQSFVHALISGLLRTDGEQVLEHIEFVHCARTVKGIIATVVQYSLTTDTD